jgi:hypothetical protein
MEERPLTAYAVNWSRLTERLARRLRALYKQQFGQKKESDLSPEVIAFRCIISQFPVPARVLVVEHRSGTAPSLYTAIRHDLLRPNTNEAEFKGVASVDQLDLGLLRDQFGIELSTLDEFTEATHYDSTGSFITQVVPYEIADAYSGPRSQDHFSSAIS